MSDISEAALSRRIEELSAENASLKSENKDRRLKARTQEADLAPLRAQVAALTTERDALSKAATAGPTEKDATIADLTSKLTSRDHRDAFAAVGTFDGPVDPKTGKAPKYKLADGVKIDALWQLTDYKAEGATPDAKAVATKLGEAQSAHPFLFTPAEPAPGGAQRPIVVTSREAGPGGGSGTSSTVASALTGLVVSRSGRPEGAV